MDGLGESFGRLSTSAQEWRPGQYLQSGHQQSTPQRQENHHHQQQSDLDASSVKEFVPGKAWSSQEQTPAAGETSGPPHAMIPEEEHIDSSHRHHGATSIPAGPSPSPVPSFRTLHSMGFSDALWRYHREIALEAHRQMDPADPRHNAVPIPYINAFCMDSGKKVSRSSFGYPSDTFQATSREDGYLYCVRRFDNVRCVSPRIAVAVMEKWNSAATVQEHPGVVPLYRCFVAQRAVFFVHQYIPGARTLRERLEGPLLEAVVWSAVVQLTSAIRAVHTCNLAVRSLDLQHVLSTTDAMGSRLRLRLNCLGVVDALEFEARKNPAELQEEDIRNLGRLILSIATGSEVNSGTDPAIVGRCEAFLAQNYSRDLHGLTMTLIKSARPPSILEVTRAIAQRALDEQDAAYVSLDKSEKALSAEYESSRILRLMLKLAFVNERPEFGPNRRWAQSGDCYVLALFRDWTFHQADGAGNPVMDLGHVTSALNKLDTADEEKMVLGVFIFTAFAWITRSFLLERFIPDLEDTIIAIVSAIALFLLPTSKPSKKILNWEEAVKLPWGILLLFGGGLALAEGFKSSGLAEWIGNQMTLLQGVTIILLVLVLVAAVNFLTEITSNLATTSMLLPILAPMALTIDVHPFILMVAATTAASCAFMLPVATPPNAVVFGSGYLRIPDMVKTGIWMNIFSIIIITLLVYFLLPLFWGFDPTAFPEALK